MPTPVIELRGLNFSFESGQEILHDINFIVERGDYVAMLGPNGSGKSTLIRLMLGLLEPTSGTVRVLGDAPSKSSRRVGYMPQATTGQQGLPLTVMDVALMGLIGETRLGFSYSRDERRRAEESLDRVDMLQHRSRRVANLSGGQRQRAYIARALISNPELLLLDEPTASVDTQGRCALLELLHELNRDMTILYVSHDLAVVASGAKSVACLNKTLHYHPRPELTSDMLTMMYGGEQGTCPVEIFTHGEVPHRVVPRHNTPGCCPHHHKAKEGQDA